LTSIDSPLGDFLDLSAGSSKIYISEPNKHLSKLLLAQGKKINSLKVKYIDMWTTDALFCETEKFQKAMKSIDVEAVDMESSVLFLLGELYNLQTASILSISDLPGTEYDLLNSNKVHPEMENGINRAIEILTETLPKL
jgi:purine-nucleoside phosphorylase